MTATTTSKQVIAVLNAPKAISQLIIFAKAIGKAMKSSPYFTASTAKIDKLIADVEVLENAEIAFKTIPPTESIQTRNKALSVVKADLKNMQLIVQLAANEDPDNAETIIASASMSIKTFSIRGKQQNTAENGVEEGSVELTGEGTGPHDWQYSTDGVTWVKLSSSRTSKTTVNDLTPGTLYYFQNRRLLANDEKTEWSPSISVRVR
jgi:hypothetical protein